MQHDNVLRELRNQLRDIQVCLTEDNRFTPKEVAAFYPVIDIINKIIYSNPDIPELTDIEIGVIARDGKLHAVQYVRSRLNCSLKLALDAVNKYIDQG